MLRSAEDEHEESGIYGLSVWAANGKSLAELTSDCEMRNARVRKTTAGRIRHAGFQLLKTEPLDDDHYNVDLGTNPSTEVIARLVDVFDPPEPNPARSKP